MEQSQCVKSQPRRSIPDFIKTINNASPAEINQTQVENLTLVVKSVLRDQRKLVSMDQRFRGQVFNYQTFRNVLLKFSVQERPMLYCRCHADLSRGDSTSSLTIFSCPSQGLQHHAKHESVFSRDIYLTISVVRKSLCPHNLKTSLNQELHHLG